MDGKIGVESTPGVGSTFWFTAVFHKKASEKPTDEAHEEITSRIEHHCHTQINDLKILLVEDNIINQKVAKGILSNMGYDISIANNGVMGLESYKANPVDIILMDIQMPVMDGFTATKEIRKFEQENHLEGCYIVALTANALKEDKEKCFAVGMNDFLTKPFKSDDITKVLEHFK